MSTTEHATQNKLSQNKLSEDQQIEELLASLVEMIKQREQLALETSFGRAISRLTEAKSLTYYRLKAGHRGTTVVPMLYFVDSEIVSHQEPPSKAFPLASNPELNEQLAKSDVEDMFRGPAWREKKLILPLRGANAQVTGYCQIENPRSDANIKQVLTLLLEFYQNFLTLLDDTERDNLTGLLNRKTLIPQISKVLRALQNRKRRTSDKSLGMFCLAILDIDHFKNVNDTYGHIYGDEVLLLLANLMRGSFRENDLLFRYGGEEFVALLNNIDIRQAQIVLERFRAKVAAHRFSLAGNVTISVGLALIRENEKPDESINRADQALYFAKNHGRNQVCVYEKLVEEGKLAE